MTVVPVSERGYARPELIVETDWLEENLGNPALRLIDTRSVQLYEEGHIPGAASLAAVGAIPRADNGDVSDPAEFARLAGALGVDEKAIVVIYDAPASAMGMVAWTFLYFGHPDVRILDGGFEKWTRENRPIAVESSSYAPAIFTPAPVDDLYCSLKEAKETVSTDVENAIFLDARRPDEYAGTAAAGARVSRPGHIPGAVNVDWSDLFDADSNTLKSGAELKLLLGSRGIRPESIVNCYCQGGGRGSSTAFILRVLGYENARSYLGAFGQWSRQPDTKVEA
jgi:thiosulfate/3-mercaptopyruvate sulfurtransferase